MAYMMMTMMSSGGNNNNNNNNKQGVSEAQQQHAKGGGGGDGGVVKKKNGGNSEKKRTNIIFNEKSYIVLLLLFLSCFTITISFILHPEQQGEHQQQKTFKLEDYSFEPPRLLLSTTGQQKIVVKQEKTESKSKTLFESIVIVCYRMLKYTSHTPYKRLQGPLRCANNR